MAVRRQQPQPQQPSHNHTQSQTLQHQPQQHSHPHSHIHYQQEKLSPQHHHNDSSAVIMFQKNCSTSSPFLHFPAPPDYPPENNHTFSRKLSNNRYPDDLDTIEVYVEEQDDCRYSYRGRKSGRNQQKSREAQVNHLNNFHFSIYNYKYLFFSLTISKVKWSRNNIAATMEKFEPINSPTSEKCQTLPMQHFHHDYSYAYYEPGAAMRHSNIPPPVDDHHPPPPNSIRALLSKRNQNLSTSSTPAKLSSNENPYEEIMSGNKSWKHFDNSLDSINQNVFKEEFKHVQNLHRRVLGELDLSVEAMIMPTVNDNLNETTQHDEPVDNLADMISSVVSTEELLSPTGNLVTGGGDIDSGFSGSSSGASYVGSLRYHRRGSGGGACSSMYGSSSRSSQRSQDDSGIVSYPTRSGSMYNGNSKSSYDGLESPTSTDQKLNKSSFWKKGWKKFPSLTSTTTTPLPTTVKPATTTNGKSKNL